MDPVSIFASAKTAYDIAKGINTLKTDVERNKAVSKILEVLLSVQNDALSMKEKHSLLLTEKDNLAQKIMEFEKWDKVELQYELKEIASGVFVYVYKKTNNSSQPEHYLCAKCYQDRKKSIFQRTNQNLHGTKYICHTCKSEILDHSKPKHDQNDNEPPTSDDLGRDGWMAKI